MKRLLRILSLGLVGACIAGGAAAREKVSLQLQWLPQAQFAGYFVAKEKGFYDEAGLDVEIRPGGPGITPFDRLIRGEVTFCTGWLAEGIAKRSRGFPVVNTAQIIQRSGLILIAKKSSNIREPRDLNGKTIGLWGGDFLLQPTIFFRKHNIQARFVQQAFSMDPFLRGALDVASAMYYNEYHRVYEAGLDFEDLVTFWFADYGLNYPEDGIYCLEETLQESADDCRGFVQASLRGWMWAFEHPQDATDIVIRYCYACNVATSRNHQVWMLNAMKELTEAKANGEMDGQLKVEDFRRVLAGLKGAGVVESAPGFEEFFQPSK